MHPTLFSLGPWPVHSYGFFVAAGFMAGILMTLYFARPEHIDPQVILDLSIYVIISAIVGARLFYVLGQPDFFLNNPAEIVMVQNGGLVYLGGLLCSMLTVYLFARRKGLSFVKLCDAIAPGTALGYALGRLGCFFNGCCFGLKTSLPWGVVFPPASLAGTYCPDQALHPTQLYSAMAGLLITAVLVWLYRRKKYDGRIFLWGLTLYALYRLLVEFFRFSPIHWLGLTPSQWIAAAVLAFCLWGFSYFRKRR